MAGRLASGTQCSNDRPTGEFAWVVPRLAVIDELERVREAFAAAAERLSPLEELDRELQRLSG